ncbi:MAG: TetR/AcrR family transcriptional regulator [Pseudomonadota bacterium]
MVEAILAGARDVLVEEGYPNLTMRKIAARAGITIGNLSYYYANKQGLLHDLLDAVFEGYIEDFERITSDAAKSAEEQFVEIIRFLMDDLTTKETTHFFPELWVLANHDDFAAEGMEDIYARERAVLGEAIGRVRPDLKPKDRALLALFVSASIEGHTVFIGHGHRKRRSAAQATNIAAYAFLTLVKSIDSATIHGLAKRNRKTRAS